MTQDKWRSLLRELKVTGAKESFCTGSDIKRLEGEFGFVFPVGYREFCEVFGSGELSGFIKVFCFCFDEVRAAGQNPSVTFRALQLSLGLEALEQELSWETDHQSEGHPAADTTKLSLLEKVLPQAFVFGDDPNAQIYLWDLGSYSELDQSCDIYLVPTDDLGDTTLLGRDFFEFISDFCLGSRAREVLPSQFRFYEEFTGKTFFRFDEELLENLLLGT